MQTQPIFDELNDNFIRDQTTALGNFRGLLTERCPEIFFPTQDRTGRCHGNAELARDHFRLGPFPGTRRAQEHESSLHLAAIKEDCDPCNH
jgi:hypothetical protein